MPKSAEHKNLEVYFIEMTREVCSKMIEIEGGKRTFDWPVNPLADVLYRFIQLHIRERVQQRNLVESKSSHFDGQHQIGTCPEANQYLHTRNRKAVLI